MRFEARDRGGNGGFVGVGTVRGVESVRILGAIEVPFRRAVVDEKIPSIFADCEAIETATHHD